MKELIQARQISKHYGALQVLSEVQLEVAEQEIVAIVGPSGAGKTTLLHILGTLDNLIKTHLHHLPLTDKIPCK